MGIVITIIVHLQLNMDGNSIDGAQDCGLNGEERPLKDDEYPKPGCERIVGGEPNLHRTEQDRAGQSRTEQDRAGQGRTRQNKTGQDRTRQGMTSHERSGGNRRKLSTVF